MKDPSVDNSESNLCVFTDEVVNSPEIRNRESKNSPELLANKESGVQYRCDNVGDHKTQYLNQMNNKQLRDLLQKQAIKEQLIDNNCFGNTSTAANLPIGVNNSQTSNGEIKLNDQILLKNRSKANTKNDKGNFHNMKMSNNDDVFRKMTKETKVVMKKETEKSEPEESAVINEVGDILGGLDNDDDLLHSLTYDMTEHFNILEYADPALDVLNDDNQHLFDKLDFDEDKSKTFFEDRYFGLGKLQLCN